MRENARFAEEMKIRAVQLLLIEQGCAQNLRKGIGKLSKPPRRRGRAALLRRQADQQVRPTRLFFKYNPTSHSVHEAKTIPLDLLMSLML